MAKNICKTTSGLLACISLFFFCTGVSAQMGTGTLTTETKQRCAETRDCPDIDTFCTRLVCVGADIQQSGDVRVSTKAGYCEPRPATAPSKKPACYGEWQCLEQHDRWELRGADRDSDGHDSLACGGDDCDDEDPGRYPSNTEICDSDGVDEDCNIRTYGNKDSDGDGAVDAMCRNYHE